MSAASQETTHELIPIETLERSLVEQLNNHPIRDLGSTATSTEIEEMFKEYLPHWDFATGGGSGGAYGVPHSPNQTNLRRFITPAEEHIGISIPPLPKDEAKELDDKIADIWLPFTDLEGIDFDHQRDFTLHCGEPILRLTSFSAEPPTAEVVSAAYQIEGILREAGIAKMEVPYSLEWV